MSASAKQENIAPLWDVHTFNGGREARMSAKRAPRMSVPMREPGAFTRSEQRMLKRAPRVREPRRHPLSPVRTITVDIMPFTGRLYLVHVPGSGTMIGRFLTPEEGVRLDALLGASLRISKSLRRKLIQDTE